MPTDLHIVRTNDFIRQNAHGEFDFATSLAELEMLAKACVSRGIHHALLDVRDMQGELSTTELYQLAKAFSTMGFGPGHCLAVLHRYFGKRAEIFATFAEERGMNVRAFVDFEEAINWFGTALPLE